MTVGEVPPEAARAAKCAQEAGIPEYNAAVTVEKLETWLARKDKAAKPQRVEALETDIV